MPVEAKPLIRPDVLRAHVAAFPLPGHIEALRAKLGHWADLIASGRIDKFKEQELLSDFLTFFFGELLGYGGPAAGERYTLSREKHVQVDGKFADAVLGDFRPGSETFVVAVEGKGPRDPLERPFAGRKMSAVDQALRYAVNLRCDFFIVTSLRQTRLYSKAADQQTYERFDTESLADDDEQLRRFLFLLGADRVVPSSGRCHLYDLIAESEQVGRDLTRDFYIRYAEMRQDAFEQLTRDNPAISRQDLLSCTQKLLDRVLFCAFSEDRGLLPSDTLRRAYEHRDPYHPRPIWENFRGLFHSINTGNAALGVHAYNGGLFADDPLLDALAISDEVCAYFRDLGSYDYRPAQQATYAPANSGSLIDVDILGHIFEQSISDLERIRNELDGLETKQKSRRKKEGAFYTPNFVTRYIVQQALGGALRDRFEALRQHHAAAAKGAARNALADPSVYTLDLKKAERAALVSFWEAWQDELTGIRILDPACGSGAFLIEAFDQLHAAYQQSNDRLEELRGHRSLFDLDKRILENNLYGVDLNEEAVEICRLSLWIKTAERGKPLTSLDHSIRVGNSIVADPAVHPRAFDWQAAFPEVFAAGGFDVVVANPPYVRQELLTPIKPYLQQAYQAYHGMADLYVYFYELGFRVLKPGGLLSFVVTNKWMKAGYAEPLRRFFLENAWIESVVDFGHAKQIFEDADVFPCIIVARKPTGGPKPATARLCTIPREQLRINDLGRQIEAEGVALPLSQLGTDAWQLEAAGVNALLAKIRAAGVPLLDIAGAEPLLGIKTGYNDAYLIDTRIKETLVQLDPGCADIIRPYVRGQDMERWHPAWAGLWMIVMKSSADHPWPWATADEGAEALFRLKYPSLYGHMKAHEAALRRRQDHGRYWWELRPCAYWDRFDSPKIIYQDIAWRAQFSYDARGTLTNNTTYVLGSADPWVITVLNSPVAWWFSWRTAVHGKDEALRLFKVFVEQFPIPRPAGSQQDACIPYVGRLIEITQQQQDTRRTIVDWLRVQFGIAKPSLRLQAPLDLDSDSLVAEVTKARGKKNPLSAAGLKALREEHCRTIEPARKLSLEALQLERQLSDLVNEAYGLTPEDIALLWQTAPPRMPFTP